MRNLMIIAAVVLLNTVVVDTTTLQAKSLSAGGEFRRVAQNNTIISKGRAIAAVKSQMEGKVLSAKLIKSQGPPVYRVKVLLSKGRVRTVFVDASNGRVIRIR